MSRKAHFKLPFNPCQYNAPILQHLVRESRHTYTAKVQVKELQTSHSHPHLLRLTSPQARITLLHPLKKTAQVRQVTAVAPPLAVRAPRTTNHSLPSSQRQSLLGLPLGALLRYFLVLWPSVYACANLVATVVWAMVRNPINLWAHLHLPLLTPVILEVDIEFTF